MRVLWLVFMSMIHSSYPIIIGHRGASGYLPENTLSSFEKAIETGADGIEFDVQICKSGEVVIIHDKSVERTTDGTGLVADLTLPELKQLDAGNGERIPTLQELLEMFAGRGIILNIELKGHGVVASVIALLKTYVHKGFWSYENFWLTSFDHFQLIEAKKLCPQIKTGVIIYSMLIDFDLYLEKLNADLAIVHFSAVRDQFLEVLKTISKPLVLFTVNEPGELPILQKDIAGIITDYPDRFSEC